MDTSNVIATRERPPAGEGPVVQLDGVTVIYGKNQALRNVSARFARGAVGLLGPNGAGKSTMLKALLGFVTPDGGRMSVLGLDVAERPMEIRARIGYMPESDAHIPGMNAVSFVAYCGQLAGLPLDFTGSSCPPDLGGDAAFAEPVGGLTGGTESAAAAGGGIHQDRDNRHLAV